MTLGEVATLPLLVGSLGLGATAVGYAILAVLLISARPGTVAARWLIAALLGTCAWGGLGLGAILVGPPLLGWVPLLDALRLASWVVFLAALLRGSSSSGLSVGLARTVSTAAAILAGVVIVHSVWMNIELGPLQRAAFPLLPLLGLPILGLLALEQVFRNSTFRHRAFLKPFSIALGAVFAVDIFSFAQAFLSAEMNANVWLLRSIASAAVAPVFLLAIKRQPDWGERLFISRQMIFYSTGLTGAGVYLVAVGVGGFALGTGEEVWSGPARVAFLILMGAVFVYALFSVEFRRHAKVFISKHFFRHRYDYRAEWLKLSSALADSDHKVSLAERSLNALTAIISSPAGELWFAPRAQAGFDRCAVTSAPKLPELIAQDDEMADFLRRTFWVVDTREYVTDPEKYTNAFAPDSAWLRTPSIVLPLIHQRRLVGIARLDRPALLGELDFKDHDLLKTAGRQVAIFLAQERSQEQLAETRQLEAFSKLTTFLMHDLKNLIAQQELVVRNARRFRHRQEFIDDAIDTIEGSVKRMRRLIERLRGVSERDSPARIALQKAVKEACDVCGDRAPRPKFSGLDNVFVAMDRDKLNMIVVHAIRNSQDATPADGRVEVRVNEENGYGVVEVEDTGAGMSVEFIRNELFKPFSSTKGAQGMGIGAYQIRETLEVIGGGVEVTSVVGTGTLVRMKIPLMESSSEVARQSVA